MNKRPLVYTTGLYSLGICAAYLQPLPPAFWFSLVLGLLLFWFVLTGKNRGEFSWLLLLSFFFLGAAFYQVRDNLQAEKLSLLPLEQETVIQGAVLKGPVQYPGRTEYLLRLPNGAKINLVIRGNETLNLEPGDIVRGKGYLARPREARNPGEFDYRAYLWRQGILARLSCSPGAVELIEPGTANGQGILKGAKDRFVKLLEEQMSPHGAGIARALIFGDKTALEQDLKDLFLILGVMHLLAVSGLHVGFLLVLVQLLQGLLPLRPGYRFLLAVLMLFFYCALTEFTPSVLRASLMALIFLLGNLLRKERDFYSGIAAAALILLVINPHYLFLSGFQLSFLAAWGIVYFSPLVRKLFPKDFRFREWLLVPLAAQLAVLPASAYYFNLVSLIGLVTNLLLVPVAGFVVIGGLVAFLVSLVSPPAAGVLLVSLGAVLDAMIGACAPLEQVPFAALKVATPSLPVIAGYYFGAVVLRELVLQEKYKALLAAAMVAALLIAGWQQWSPRPLEVVFLDVGQGDAIFMKTPKGTTILLDGGGTPGWQNTDYRVGKDVVIPYLERRGIKELDLLISSHPDTDHLQGLEEVLAELGAKTVVIPPRQLFGDGYLPLLAKAAGKRVPVRELVAGDTVMLDDGNVILEILNPPAGEPAFFTAPDNNHSLVVRVRYGRAAFLLTGDVELEALKGLLEQGQLGPATIFKAPHHGSRTGYYEPYLDGLQPVGVVLSVGRNSYGHPAPELVEYWEARQVGLYRTDEQGAIMIYTDGTNLKIRPFL